MFLGLLKLGLEMVKPGGYLLYVLPHSFLVARNSRGLRGQIASDFWVRFVADLSQVPVFESTGSYTILLIAQRKPQALPAAAGVEPRATVVRCREFVGYALQESLEGKTSETDFYEIYEAEQAVFQQAEWRLDSPREAGVQSRLGRLPALSDYLTVRQGFVTGADGVFIRPASAIPAKEHAAYRPFLSDREMRRYSVPAATDAVVFYPYVNGSKITEKQLKEEFAQTWKYLSSHRKTLAARRSVGERGRAWWEPIRPRPPEHMLRPKLVAPHLVLIPRFALDEEGRYAVSRSPLLYPEQAMGENATEMLRFFLAVLNSSVAQWQIARHSHRYSRGYAMLEVKTLKKMRVPDPAAVSVATMNKLQSHVAELMRAPEQSCLDHELDDLVAGLYGLTVDERRELGLEG